MKNVILSLLFLIFFISIPPKAFSQDIDSLLTQMSASADTVPLKLLPDKMLITQRMLWGENGLYRKIGIAPKLTVENRAKELKTRRSMLRIHQAVGFLTAAGMVAQGILGSKMYNFDFTKGNFDDYERIQKTHRALATGINISYATTALMSFTAPPVQVRRQGISNTSVHKALSYIHLTGMITTNILAGKIAEKPSLKPYHRAAAFSTFGTFAAAILVIKFEI